MKLSRFIAFASLAVILFVGILAASLPARFPGSRSAWEPMLIFITPALILLVLLLTRPILQLKVYRVLLLLAALLAFAATVGRWVAPVVLCMFLIALAALYLQGDPRYQRRA